MQDSIVSQDAHQHSPVDAGRINGLATDPSNPPLVRVSGYLLFDSEPVSRSGDERAANWEIHPV
ncbi:MAG TPA: hypothetical protein VKB48_15450 [Candidatus Acidoferrum sp.]|nr:hypothetical protein [Candidatus Acidoferrum sp.]